MHDFQFVQFSFSKGNLLFKSFLGLVLGLVDNDWVWLRLGVKVGHLLLGWIGSCSLEGFFLESSHFSTAVLSGACFDKDKNEENGADDHAPFEEIVELSVVGIILLLTGLFLIVLFKRSVVPHLLRFFFGGKGGGLLSRSWFLFGIGSCGGSFEWVIGVLLDSGVRLKVRIIGMGS